MEYTYDYAGRMKTMKTWQNFAEVTGAALTTWNYDSSRGWLVSKRYQDNLGPDYIYTSAGRLQSRLWARESAPNSGTRPTTSHPYNNAGELVTVIYYDAMTPVVTNLFNRLGRPLQTQRDDMTANLARYDAGSLLSESYNHEHSED